MPNNGERCYFPLVEKQIILGLGLSAIFASIRYRWPAIPKPLADGGIALGVGFFGLSLVPDIRIGPLVVGGLALALAAIAVSWQLTSSEKPSSKAEPTSPPTSRPANPPLPKANGPVVVEEKERIGNSIAQGVGRSRQANPQIERPAPQLLPESIAPSGDVVQSLSVEQKRILVADFYSHRETFQRLWITRGGGEQLFNDLNEVMHRAGIEIVSDLQYPSHPQQTGIVICVPDSARPTEKAKLLRQIFQRAGVETTLDKISERQSSRPNDAPDLVVFIAPRPL